MRFERGRWVRAIFERLASGGRLLTVLEVAVAVSLFLPWHRYAILGIRGTTDGFHSWGLVTALGVVVTVWALTADDRPRRVAPPTMRIVGTALEFLGAALYLAIGPGSYHSDKVQAAYGPSYGAVVAFLAALAAFLLVLRQGVPHREP